MAYLLFLFLVSLLTSQVSANACAQAGASLQKAWIKLDRAKVGEDLKVTFAIRQSNTQWLDEKANSVSDPESPDYGNYMNFDEIAQHVYGISDSVSAVKELLLSVGVEEQLIQFTLGQDFAIVQIPVGVAEGLFEAEFYSFQHAIKRELQVVRSAQYTLPTSLSGHVDYVLGISITDLPEFPLNKGCTSGGRKFKESNETKLRNSNETELTDMVTPFKIQQVYNMSGYVASNPQSSQAVASFMGQYYNSEDLERFLTQFNLTAGKIDDLGFNNGSDRGQEADLDMQYIFSTGQGVSTSFIPITKASRDGLEDFLMWVVGEVNSTTSPLVHSLSYADIESMVNPSYRSRTDVELKKFAVSGRTVLISSADSGVLCDKETNSFSPYWPSSSQYVTAVGGTMPDVETVWPGSGGGFSNFIPAPDYQLEAIRGYLASGKAPDRTYFNAKGRAYPDLSAFAANCLTIFDDKYEAVDGTSCAAPIVAGESCTLV